MYIVIYSAHNPVSNKTVVKGAKLAGLGFCSKVCYKDVDWSAILCTRKELIAFVRYVLF